jgi:hypothetical protein
MLTDNTRKQLKILIIFDDLLDDKKPRNKTEAWKYCEYLKELCEAATQDYIDDNELEEEK